MPRLLLIPFLLLLLFSRPASAQSDRTVGLLHHDPTSAWQGYTLFFPISTKTFLLDMDGQVVHMWDIGYNPGLSAYLLPDGNLLRPANVENDAFPAGGRGGLVHIFRPDGSVAWRFEYSDENVSQHHDVAHLPNGNILMVAWEKKSYEESLQAGRDPERMPENEVWSDTIIEVRPTGPTTGEIVWKWDAFDHLIQDFDPTKDNYGVVADHPELLDINAGAASQDWMHVNSINYNPELDQIVISSRQFSEFFVIDHATPSGEILYRWGNPANYDRGTEADQQLFVQHDAQWIAPGRPGAGNFLVYNNGAFRSGPDYSSVDELVPPQISPGVYTIADGQAFRPLGPLWSYTATPEESFFSAFISGAERLPNGNTLITSGAFGDLFEVTSDGREVWRYKNPIFSHEPIAANAPIPEGERDDRTDNLVFRAYRYAPDYPGLAFLDMTPQGPIELPFIDTAVEDGTIPGALTFHSVWPNPAHDRVTAGFDLVQPAEVTLGVFDVLGRQVRSVDAGLLSAGPASLPVNLDGLPAGLYVLRMGVGDRSVTRRLVVR